MFAKITMDIQREYEKCIYSVKDGTPEICGLYGRRCRVMAEPDGDGIADRFLCDSCQLALFAFAAGSRS